MSCFQAQCQSLKINNCPQLISEFGLDAVRRDNICKTQCSFVLNALDPENGGNGRPHHQNFFLASDTLEAPGFFGDIGGGNGGDPIGGPLPPPASTSVPQPQLAPRPPFRGPTTAIGSLGRPGAPPPIPPGPPPPPRAPRPPPSPQIVPPPPVPTGAGPSPSTANGRPTSGSQINPTRQPRPLFNFIPRLPNFSELFGV